MSTPKIHEYRRIESVEQESGSRLLRPELSELVNGIILGDCRKSLSLLPDESVQCIVTSPPYFRQRDYGVAGQVGCESSVSEYVSELRAIFHECKRVLKRDGLLWVNLGDKFEDGLLLGVPWRTCFALSDDGWQLRSDVIWQKPNAMPSSVRTRPTQDHEYVFMFSRSSSFTYFADAIREPHVTFSEKSRMKGGRNHFGKAGGTPERGKNAGNANLHKGRWDQAFHPLGRNKRTVWSIPLSKYRGAHFAVFPEKLVETCMLASTQPGDVVLDPFCGSGTTLAVAKKYGRKFVGVELNRDYCKMAQERLAAVTTQLPFPSLAASNG